MSANDLCLGCVVRVKSLGSATGMLCDTEHLALRREGAWGRVAAITLWAIDRSYALVWVWHKGLEAPYWSYELELVGTPA